jgi:tRNA U34 5-carboxymethylaminomethyl modifying enzyme MnmG/GidA
MALRDELLKRGMKIMQDPKVAKLVQDERVMKVAMQAFQLRTKVQDEIDGRVEKVAKSLGLVTKNEVKDLRRTLKKLENELEKTKKAAAEARATPKGA